MIQRELPENVYRDGKPESSYTTAEVDSVAKTLETAYKSLGRIYDNYFPASTVEYLNKWEQTVFGTIGNESETTAQRVDRILTKLRLRRGITKLDIAELVWLVIGSDKMIEIIEFNSMQGSWLLGVSELGRSTILNGNDVNNPLVSGPDIWEKTAGDFGITQAELDNLKKNAYGYRVKIINYEATAEELAQIEALLFKYEPARCWHEIENNATLEEATFMWLLGYSKLSADTYL